MASRRSVTPLDPTAIARLRAADFTYSGVGATKIQFPVGYHHARREVSVGAGERRLRDLGEAILGWQVQLGSGLRVASSAPRVDTDEVALVGIGLGPLQVMAPVRVVYVIDEPGQRYGFAYGTLPGHPVAGEEMFCVERQPDDTIVFVVTAFSRPDTLLTKVAGPMGRIGQRVMAARYIRAMRYWH
ncbi:DUF1990 domain-containing protein [Skermania sp. ID1734]|uniref:DUF1990 family protein n=1 Tax=Skermania sp. ID1734 TaxID=2597516 RepID=UPI0011807FE8|nr:DUF1990 domain-containing protein [Skermania sp. ID1734]TSE01578.1 DUF1990 domain-containing protein [Skermania sp. ID1734]